MSVDGGIKWNAFGRSQLRVLLDVLLLAGLLLLAENFRRLWGPATQRGFFCDDETLMYPYREDTVTPSMQNWTSLYLPVVAFLIIEIYSCRKRVLGVSRWTQFWPLYNTIRWFLFGHVTEKFLKTTCKQVIGRLRPHFFEVCRPQLPDGSYCTSEENRHSLVYHTEYTCRPDLSGASQEMLRDIHVSFPSGHSSMVFYGMIFMALYLQRRFRSPKPSSLLRPLCQLMLVGYALFVGLSRVMDYKHHWSDVVAGSLLGASIAFVVMLAADKEQRLHQISPLSAPVTKEVSIPVAAPSPTPPSAAPSVVTVEQLPHDLCCVVTCHSSN